MSELIALTGITGFVGMRIAEQALNNGYRVRATVRKHEHGEKVRSLIQKEAATDGLEFAEANLLSDYGWDDALAGSSKRSILNDQNLQITERFLRYLFQRLMLFLLNYQQHKKYPLLNKLQSVQLS